MSRQNIKMYVEELLLIESGSYVNQFMRPYVTELKGGLIDKLDERFQKSRRFTPSILAGIANQFMVPDYRTRGVIEIPNGWSTRRGRFVMTIAIELPTGDRLRQVVMGYTNSVGFTERNVDPHMDFYVNNTFMLVRRTKRDRDGRQEYVWTPQDVNDVLSDCDNSGLRRETPELYTMRPEDVYSGIDLHENLHLVDDMTDTRLILNKNAIKSRSSNRIGQTFMSNVLTGRQKAIDNESYSNASHGANATAQGYVTEAYATDDMFLEAMRSIRGTNMTEDNFTFRDLISFDRDVENRVETSVLNNEARSQTNYRDDDVNDLAGQEEEDRVAALIGIATPALMLEHGIHGISFQAHNRGRGNSWDFIPSNARSLIKDVDISSFIEEFGERYIDELLMPITGGNLFDVAIDVRCRAFGEVDFTLFWDGTNHGRYVIPVFTNSKASPIVTDNRQDVLKMSKDFSDLFEHFLPANTIGGGNTGGGFSF